MTEQKIVSQLDPAGYLVGPTIADESPLEPGVFLIPGGAIDRVPPEMQPGVAYRPDDAGDGWIEEEDHRIETLYRTSDGAVYPFGALHADETYSGIGPIPAWLTANPRPDAWSVWNDGAWARDEAAWAAEMAATERAWRGEQLDATDALVQRHRDEIEDGAATTLSADQYQQLQAYRRALRKWPESSDFPASEKRPAPPAWLSESTPNESGAKA
ncbi:phage tail assembly chaperone [Achromobacter ruhlandii]|uniref:phage tail assembly chaperone n=1 Tax=Achromobacter ruhlandii TaxID=72557 RepID=UPI000A4B6FCE|nr:phage tail assembly chaperone [Achromobacter ruhlandii]